LSKFTEVLKNRNFFLLWIGQVISQLGDRLDQMALIGLVYMRAPGSAMQIAKILSFTIIPVFVVGPIAGVYVDRWDRRRVMYACDLLRAALVLSIPFFLTYGHSLIPIYLVIFVVFSIGRFFVPAKLSIIPDLVPPKDLVLANSLVNTTGMIAAILGFGISGLVVEWLGAKAAFYLDSLSFLISAALIFAIAKNGSRYIPLSSLAGAIVEVIRKSVFQEIKDGVIYFFREKRIGFIAGLTFVL
jgi:MFS transporter, DHA3 family, macrolide efflux protein